MILVDTAIWIDHLHRADPHLTALLANDQVSTHAMIIGELAMGTLRDRTTVLTLMHELPRTPVASHEEVLRLVDAHSLRGVGLGLVDAHLLAAARLSELTSLWTRDWRLRAAAERLGVSAPA